MPSEYLNLAKRAIIPLAAAVLGAIALLNGWLWLGCAALAVVALGIYDWFQRRQVITRNYPVAGRIRCVLSTPAYLRAYIVEDDLHGTPFPSMPAIWLTRGRMAAAAHIRSGPNAILMPAITTGSAIR